MKLRNISPDTLELRLPELSRSVAPDEVIEIGDDIADKYGWPEALWVVVATRKTTKES